MTAASSGASRPTRMLEAPGRGLVLGSLCSTLVRMLAPTCRPTRAEGLLPSCPSSRGQPGFKKWEDAM